MIPHEDFLVLLLLFFLKYLLHTKCYFCFLPTLFFFFLKTSDVSKRSVCFKIARLKFMMSLQCIIWVFVFVLNNFSRVINLLLTKLPRDHTGRISALGLFCMDLATLEPYCQDLRPIFSLYGPRAWLIRYMYCMGIFNQQSRKALFAQYSKTSSK